MQSAIISNRVFLGIVAFSVSFGLSLVPNWDFSRAMVTGVITLLATYAAVFCVEKRRRAYEMLVFNSLHKRIKELEGLKSRIVREIDKIEEHRSLLYTESNQLRNQVAESRNQRDSINRELSSFAGQKKQLEAEISVLRAELHSLDKNKTELQNSFSLLTAEKRRLELNCHTSRTEINQLQNQLVQLHDARQEIENHLTLLARIKPQIEEKIYEMRLELQELEIEFNEQNILLIEATNKKADIESSLNNLQTQIKEQQAELEQLQSQVTLLQQERDLLQSQVWELLQQMETFAPESFSERKEEDEADLFPFSELTALIETTDNQKTKEILPEEWINFMHNLETYQIQVLKAILEQKNIRASIKQIAETNITMPNLIIDAINERANDILGELVINPGEENPEIYPEHISHISKMLTIYEDNMARQAASN